MRRLSIRGGTFTGVGKEGDTPLGDTLNIIIVNAAPVSRSIFW